MKALAFALLAALAASLHANTATFDDLSFSSATPNYENGKSLAGSYASGGLTFNNAYDATYGSWSDFAYSQVRNATTAGYGNQYAAYAGGAFSGSDYGVSYGTGARIALPAGQSPLSMEVTNTTYAALSMLNGDPFAKRFATGDFFILTATGYANGVATGSASLPLADYRFANASQDYVLQSWTLFDLSGLGAATSIGFSYASSDVGAYGINTPTYFALDDVRTQPVPEPATFAALGLGLLAVVRRRKAGAR